MKGASSIPKHEMNRRKGILKHFEEMRNEGKMIQQETSYVVRQCFCIYNAENANLIKEHAKRSGGVATEIEITTVIMHNTSVVS